MFLNQWSVEIIRDDLASGAAVPSMYLMCLGWKTFSGRGIGGGMHIEQMKLALKFEHVSHSICNFPPTSSRTALCSTLHSQEHPHTPRSRGVGTPSVIWHH